MAGSRLGTAALVAVAAGTSGVLAWWSGRPLPDWLFLTVVLTTVGLLVRQAGYAWRAARDEHGRDRRLARTEPDEVALAAVREERRRLNDDITRCLRDALVAVRAEARQAAGTDDPRPALRRIREHATGATSELRRQLGLLRDPAAEPAGSPPATPPPPGRHRPQVVLAAAAVLLAVAESVGYPLLEGASPAPPQILLSALAAATVVTRGTAPGLGAAGCASVYLLATGWGVPLSGGFWAFASVGVLLWTLSARGRSLLDAAGGLALVAASVTNLARLDPDNLAFWIGLVAMTSTGGALVRAGRRLAERSRASAEVRQRLLATAAETAAGAERQLFARELHDVVSHAVGLIGVQAGAAEVVWAADRAAARRSIAIVADTADRALAELHRLVPDRPGRQLRYADLDDLVERIRLSGTEVRLQVDANPSDPLDERVYRIVQEALTNVVRHAPGADAEVVVGTDHARTRVEVRDRGTSSTAPGRGYGLVGLAERVALAGGLLESGAVPDGPGFRVAAELPAEARLPT